MASPTKPSSRRKDELSGWRSTISACLTNRSRLSTSSMSEACKSNRSRPPRYPHPEWMSSRRVRVDHRKRRASASSKYSSTSAKKNWMRKSNAAKAIRMVLSICFKVWIGNQTRNASPTSYMSKRWSKCGKTVLRRSTWTSRLIWSGWKGVITVSA